MKGNKTQHSRSILEVTNDAFPNSLGPNNEVQNNNSSKSSELQHGKFQVSLCSFAQQGVLSPWIGWFSNSLLFVFTLTLGTSAVIIDISKRQNYLFVT